jgi:hypothetical protein
MGVDIYVRGHVMIDVPGDKLDGYELTQRVYAIASFFRVSEKVSDFFTEGHGETRNCDAKNLHKFVQIMQGDDESGLSAKELKVFSDAAEWIEKGKGSGQNRFVQVSISF